MKIAFNVTARHLDEAFKMVSIVPPRVVDSRGGAGYLLVVREGSLYVYSRDATHAARARVAISDVEGEGAFIYPAKHADAFGYLGDEQVQVQAVVEEGAHRVSYSTGSGAAASRPTFDPRMMAPLDRDLEAAVGERTFPAALLRDGLTQIKAFLPKPNEQGLSSEAFRAAQLFDGVVPPGEKAKGYLYGTNGRLAFFFRSAAFFDKGLHVHGQHLPMLLSFLGKAEGDVTIRDGATMTFAEDSKGNVLGWAHFTKKHEQFTYYSVAADTWQAKAAPGALLSALRYVRSELEKQAKVTVRYDAAGKQLWFGAASHASDEKVLSFPVPVDVQAESGEWSGYFNLDNLIELFSGVKGNELEIRSYTLPPNESRVRPKIMFRSVDDYVLAADGKVVGGSGVEAPEGCHQCRVTRFLSSME